MTKEITVLAVLVALLLLFGGIVLLFYMYWNRMMKQVLQANKEARAEKGIVDEIQEPGTKKTLPERFYLLGGPVILILSGLFPLLYVLFKSLLFLGKTDGMKGGVAAFLVILFILFTVVVAVLGLYEKNPKRRFWMELIPAIALEALLALLLATELNFDQGGHYRRHTIEGWVLLLSCFFAYAEKTRRNWKRMLLADKTER